MRTTLRSLVIAASLLGPGCQFVCHIGKNMEHEPLLACDEKQIKHRNVKLGKLAWNEMVRQYGECFSCDYRAGFVAGFADYLTYGGCIGGDCGTDQNSSCASGNCHAKPSTDGANGHAGSFTEAPVCPPVPPEKYQRKRYMTPEGCHAIEEWYTGFRHGAATAMASGLRNLQVVPVQCPPKFGPEDGFQAETSFRPSNTGTTPAKETPAPMPPPEEITQPGADTLPTPRPAGEGNPVPPALPPPPTAP